jgi:hypothetical protein
MLGYLEAPLSAANTASQTTRPPRTVSFMKLDLSIRAPPAESVPIPRICSLGHLPHSELTTRQCNRYPSRDLGLAHSLTKAPEARERAMLVKRKVWFALASLDRCLSIRLGSLKAPHFVSSGRVVRAPAVWVADTHNWAGGAALGRTRE